MTTLVDALRIAEREASEAERLLEQARGIAVALEQQIAAALTLHARIGYTNYWVCEYDEENWPCQTARALGVES